MIPSVVSLGITILLLAGVFAAIGLHMLGTKAINVLDGHLERLQSKLDVLMVAQNERNEKIDIILSKLL